MRPAIDFGSCFSRAAFLDGETITLVKDPATGSLALPSAVFVTSEGQVVVGEEANSRSVQDLKHYRREIRRYLGNKQPLMDHFLPEMLISRVLERHKQIVDMLMCDSNRPLCTGAVITIPATYQENKCILMREAATQAGFLAEEVTLLDEATAVAHYYDHQDPLHSGERVLVYDLGGTFHAALLEKSSDTFVHLVDPLGLEQCGGTRFDQILYATLMNNPTIQRALQTIRSSESMQIARIRVREAGITLKHQLSSSDETSVTIAIPEIGEPIQYRLSREEFHQMISSIVQETIAGCMQMLQDARLTPGLIDRILFAGGSCAIPFIQAEVQRAFNRPSSIASALDLVVCQGAAYYAAAHNVYVVSPDGSNGASKTISEALEKAEPGDRIVVHPGLYQEQLEIDSSIEIVGVGPREGVILAGICEIDANSTDRIVLQGCSLRGDSLSLDEDEDMEAAVVVEDGELVLENCSIDLEKGAGVYVEGPGRLTMRSCHVHTNGGLGVVIADEGKGTIEDCQIIGNGEVVRKASVEDWLESGMAGVMVGGTGSSLHMRRCQLYGHMMEVMLADEGQAFIEQCTMYGGPQYLEGIEDVARAMLDPDNEDQLTPDSCVLLFGNECRLTLLESELYQHFGGIVAAEQCFISVDRSDLHNCSVEVAINEGASIELLQSKLHDQKTGLVVGERSRGILKNCYISRSEITGILVFAESGNANAIDCEIHDGKSTGVVVANQGGGTFERCKFYRNEGPAIKVVQGVVELDKCHIHKGKYLGISISGKGVGRLRECHFLGEAGVGVRVSGEGSSVTMRECTLKGQQGVGVVVEESGNASLWFCQFDERGVKLYAEPGSHVDGDSSLLESGMDD